EIPGTAPESDSRLPVKSWLDPSSRGALAHFGQGSTSAGQEIVNLGHRFQADDEGVDRPQAEDVAERGVAPLGLLEGPFAEDFHADDALAGVVHLLEPRGDLVGLLVVHLDPFGIDPRQVNLDERAPGRDAEGVHAMAARAMSA